jgi:hypothetical protein
MSTGIGVNSLIEHRRGDGYLIYGWNAKRAKWAKYETWRSEVCHRNRDRKLWLPFREGKFNILILLYAIYLKITRR